MVFFLCHVLPTSLSDQVWPEGVHERRCRTFMEATPSTKSRHGEKMCWWADPVAYICPWDDDERLQTTEQQGLGDPQHCSYAPRCRPSPAPPLISCDRSTLRRGLLSCSISLWSQNPSFWCDVQPSTYRGPLNPAAAFSMMSWEYGHKDSGFMRVKPVI